MAGAMATASRKAISTLLLPTTAALGSCYLNDRHNNNDLRNKTYCDAAAFSSKPDDPALKQKSINSTLRKRMTSIGRFSLRSETVQNPSIPTFFVTLVGKPTTPQSSKNNGSTKKEQQDDDNGMRFNEFEHLWNARISGTHERFQSRVCKDDNRFFEPSTSNLNHYVTESLPFSIPRVELMKRVEHMLTQSLDVNSKLWSAQICSGPLGSSGALSKSRVRGILNNDATVDKETVVLFRAHHALADGVSLGVALSDLSDEGDQLRELVKDIMHQMKAKRKSKHKARSLIQRLVLLLKKILGFWVIGSIKALTNVAYLSLFTTNPFSSILSKELDELTPEEKRELVLKGVDIGKEARGSRSLSWCEAAPVDEIKKVIKTLSPTATINDVFVSCVSYAIVKQLEEHKGTNISKDAASEQLPKYMNVAIPVHLRGGVVPPGESMGNKIGAMLAQVPAAYTPPNNNNQSQNNPSTMLSATDRLTMVSKSISATKRTPAPLLGFLMAKFCSDILPETLSKSIMTHATSNAAVSISNVRGPSQKMHWNGRTVESTAGFLPLPPGMPVGVVVQSYAGVVSLSVTADKRVVPDADRFLGWMLEEYTRLCDDANCKKRMMATVVEQDSK